MFLLGVIGHPVGHSLSPRLHNWALRHAGLCGAYHAWDIAPHDLAAFVQAVRLLPIHGVSVTIPHKEAILRLVDGVTPEAKAIGAANTLLWAEGKLVADNTDVTGFMAPIAELSPGRALVLGAGGAARAAVYGLRERGWQVAVTARNLARAQTLATDLGAEAVPWEKRTHLDFDLLVNATPLGMRGAQEDCSPWEAALPAAATVYDMVYTPDPTRLVRHAQDCGCTTISGLAMFVAQAQAQFTRWTQATFPGDQAHALLAQALCPCPA
jgi:shikimate dehydrogenase